MALFRKKNQAGSPKVKKPLWKRILKWTGISFLLLLALLIALPFVFKDRIFEMVKQEINKNLNAKFECEDYDLTLISTFPNFTLELKNVKLSGVDHFEGTDLIKTENILVTVDLYSVLWGDQIDIRKIGLVKPDIHVLVLEDGRANYDIVKTDTTLTGVDTTVSEPSKFALKLREYYIEKGNITYDDRAGAMYARLANVNHRGEGDFTQDLFEFRTTTTVDTLNFVYDGIPYFKNTRADIQLNLDMDMPNMKFTFKDNLAKLNALELGFDGFVAMPADDIDMDIRFEAKKTDFGAIYSMVPAIYTQDYSSIKFTGKTAFNGFVKGIYNEQSMPGFNIDLLVENGSFQYPDLPKSATDIFVKANINSKGDPSMDDIVVDVPTLNMNLGGNYLKAFLHLVNPMTDPGIRAGLDAKFNLATLKDVIPMEEGEEYNGLIDADVRIDGRMSAIEQERYEQFKAEGKIIATQLLYKTADLPPTQVEVMEFNFSPRFLELAKLEASYDKSRFSANGKIDNYLAYALKDETLKGFFNLSSPELDFGTLMGTSSEEAATPAAAPAPETAPLGVEPTATGESYVFEVPGNIDFELNSNFGKIIYPNDPGKPAIVLENVKGKIVLRDQTMTLENLRFNTLEANVNLDGSYSTKESKTSPDVKFRFDIANMDIQKAAATFNTIEKLAPIASKCTGKFSTSLTFNTKLNQLMEPVYETLNGSGVMQTKSIFIEGFEPLNKLAESLKINRLAKQNIQDVKITYAFKDGRLWVEPYTVKINNYKTVIEGSTGLDQTLDYKLDMAIPRSEFGGAANNVLNNLLSQANTKTGMDMKLGDMIDVRVLVTGTVSDPKIKTDLKDQLKDAKEDVKQAVKEKVEEKIEEVKEDIKAKASEEAEKIIRAAEVKADQLRAEAKKAADKLRSEAKSAGEKLVQEAGNNPLTKGAAKKAAEKLEKEAEEKAQKLEREADEKAKKVIDDAREQADKLK